ncbi:MAG: hypothetical protein ACREP1_01455 [Rhodanobacteraceae bacterium]
MLSRRCEREWLDHLAADDPSAIRSRADLRRVNRLMGALTLMLAGLDRIAARGAPSRLIELGAGDGHFMLRLARQRAQQWPGVEVVLLDLRPSVSEATLDGLRQLGWRPRVLAIDVFDWLRQQPQDDGNAIVLANLFAHHFEGENLARLRHGIAARARGCVLCEPRRSRLALASSHLLGVVGCNDVTRHDAVASVHAGFAGHELTTHWPDAQAWSLKETRAGLFSHRFVAMRSTP